MELAAAILIIGSTTDIVISLIGLAATTGEPWAWSALSLAVSVGLVALGMLVRNGRAWLVTINVAAVAAFLELRSVTAVGVTAAVLDMLVVGLLLRSQWWFRWSPPER